MILTPGSGHSRIGLFGGSFDPPHWGHIRTAQAAADELNLDQLAFLPAAKPPHKRDRFLTPFDLRRRMLELCLPLDPRFRLCLIEGGGDLPGMTLDTVKRLRDLGFTEDRCHLIWLLGSDSLLDLDKWYHPLELLDAIEVAVLPRPGYPPEQARRQYLDKVIVLNTPLIDVSAKDIRAHRQTLTETVPPAVTRFIIEHKLYRYNDNPS